MTLLTASPMSPPRAIVFDFDQTLCRIHTCSRDRSVVLNAPLARLFPPDTARMLHALIEKGYLIAIASFGHYAIIQQLLHRLVPGVASRIPIVTPRTLGGVDGVADARWRKARMLHQLAHAFHIRDPRQLLLLDDTWANVHDAVQHGFSAVHVRYDHAHKRNNLLALVRALLL